MCTTSDNSIYKSFWHILYLIFDISLTLFSLIFLILAIRKSANFAIFPKPTKILMLFTLLSSFIHQFFYAIIKIKFFLKILDDSCDVFENTANCGLLTGGLLGAGFGVVLSQSMVSIERILSPYISEPKMLKISICMCVFSIYENIKTTSAILLICIFESSCIILYTITLTILYYLKLPEKYLFLVNSMIYIPPIACFCMPIFLIRMMRTAKLERSQAIRKMTKKVDTHEAYVKRLREMWN
ncbi:unnamed protein product [Caenorhabditis angaria]|uniref:Uncharacterized protein n=1 Tax=Caenorhabditis angaria TaxID=860376 RepID=A0A9P1IBE0_9PELO|nr:unnamed protein product [Caenorhabditis angaria]